MELETLRKEIDLADSAIIKAFNERMNVASKIAKFKEERGIPVFDPARERQKLFDMTSGTNEDIKTYGTALYTFLFELSKSYQRKVLNSESAFKTQFKNAIENIKQTFPKQAIVACQGTEGAYSQIACEKLFSVPSITYCNSFANVFSAIDSGLCKYGILPIENSTAGSINQVYDLMMNYNCSIVRSVRLKIDHQLLSKKGVKKSSIKEIISHDQAINQCAEYLKSLGNVKITSVANTAIAAKMVAESDRSDIAALSSNQCAKVYGLEVLDSNVQDQDNNYTRFICVSKDPEIYAGADRTSVMLSIPHRPGSLFKILAQIFGAGVNLTKLESRPMPEKDFEFMFYFDLETSVYSEELIDLLNELSIICDTFKYFGSYSEVV